MNKRDLRLSKYGISGKRYKELCGFCEQYPEWKRELAELHAEPASPMMSDMPKAPMSAHSKVESLVIRRTMLEEKIKLIEDSAKEADPIYWQRLIDSACYEVPYAYLNTMKNMFTSQSAFYNSRRYFFYLLDRAKQ